MSGPAELSTRLTAWSVALVAAVGFSGALSLLFTEGFAAAAFLLDRNSPVFAYAFTLQNLMWLIFFGALGGLAVRTQRTRLEWAQLTKRLLPVGLPTPAYDQTRWPAVGHGWQYRNS